MDAPARETPFHLSATVSRLLTADATAGADRRRTLGVAAQDETVFRGLLREISSYHGRRTPGMREMRLRDDKVRQGKVWEHFCVEWLRAQRTRSGEDERRPVYKAVWLLSDLPEDVLDAVGLFRQDAGIDAVAELHEEQPATMYDATDASLKQRRDSVVLSRFIAVQCKFRKPGKLGRAKRLPWKELCTFVGLSAVTGPWVRGLVMTNAPGLGTRVPKKRSQGDSAPAAAVRQRRKDALGERFQTIAFGRFDATKRRHWQRIAGTERGRRFTDTPEAEVEEVTPHPTPAAPLPPPPLPQRKPAPKRKKATPKPRFPPAHLGHVLGRGEDGIDAARDASKQLRPSREELRRRRLVALEGGEE
jgi:hypothetical protein